MVHNLITLIACIDLNNGIGDDNSNLLFNLPNDMKHFKETTMGKIVVMGRKTWDSLPKKPLEKRKNYILTRNTEFKPIGAKVLHDVSEVLELAKLHDVFIIGGGETYKQLLPYANKMILTVVNTVSSKSKVYFPKFNWGEWRIVHTERYNKDDKHEYNFKIITLERVN